MKTAEIYLDYDIFYIKLKKHAKQYPALGMDTLYSESTLRQDFSTSAWLTFGAG